MKFLFILLFSAAAFGGILTGFAFDSDDNPVTAPDSVILSICSPCGDSTIRDTLQFTHCGAAWYWSIPALYDTCDLSAVWEFREASEADTLYSFSGWTDYRTFQADTIKADIYAISGDTISANYLEDLFDGTGAPLWIDSLNIGKWWTPSRAGTAINIQGETACSVIAYTGKAFSIYSADTAINIYGYRLGAKIHSPYGFGLALTSDELHGLYAAGGRYGIYAYGDSAGALLSGAIYGLYSRGVNNGAVFSGLVNGIYTEGSVSGIQSKSDTYAGLYLNAPVGIVIDSAQFGYIVNADSIAGFYQDKNDVNLRIQYVDSVGNIPAVTIDTAGLAREATVTAARDSILDIGNADWITSDGDTNLFDFAAARDSIITVGDANWTTATGFATPANVVSALDSIISNGNIKWTTADSTYLLGGVNVVSPYAYASNRVRLENLNTPIKWAQAEQDTIKWDIDTSLALSTFDSVIVVFRAWKSRTDTTTIIYDTCAVDTANNTAALYIASGETDTLTSGNYPADLWLERYSGLIILKTQIWNKTIQIDRSSRGSR
jgi:hypothetical protein